MLISEAESHTTAESTNLGLMEGCAGNTYSCLLFTAIAARSLFEILALMYRHTGVIGLRAKLT